jgi:glyceraldehyde-3-phosphate dehydrogenase (NADP+)
MFAANARTSRASGEIATSQKLCWPRSHQLTLILCLLTLLGVTKSEINVCPSISSGSLCPSDPSYQSKPFVDGSKVFVGGKIINFDGVSVSATSPIRDSDTGERIVIGKLAQMEESDALGAVAAANKAWDKGLGTWPQMSPEKRIEAIELYVKLLELKRAEIIDVLMWEICKSTSDAAAEFDRTVAFIKASIAAVRELSLKDWSLVSGITSKVRRLAIGIMLALGPFNYPFNETYATLIPALLAGNVVIMKVPTIGGMAHMLTMEAFASALPPGVINFVSGSGRKTMPPIMRTGDIDILAFIGGSKTADLLIKQHPEPHRLKVFLQLEGKNLGIIYPDADLEVAVEQVVLGATSYNGQRCTAIKLIMVDALVAEKFMALLLDRIAQLKVGLPWMEGVTITPLPESDKPAYLQSLIADAIDKGASVVNKDQGGGELDGALFRPAVVYPVTKSMRLWREEQFGPVIPVAVYHDVSELYEYYKETPFGQQAAVFTSSSKTAAPLLEILSTAVGRININTQCGRSPDSLPFSGRRSSALGTMSVTEAFFAFSVEVLVAAKSNLVNDDLLKDFGQLCQFLEPMKVV